METEELKEEIEEKIKNYQETIEILHRDIDELKLINQQATQEQIKDEIEFLKDNFVKEEIFCCPTQRADKILKERLEELKQKLKGGNKNENRC
jgi:hypothetical protein